MIRENQWYVRAYFFLQMFFLPQISPITQKKDAEELKIRENQ